EDAMAQAEGIAEVVSDGRMPPWYASPEFGHFSNRRSLTAEEKQKLTTWVSSGMELGDPARLPKPMVATKPGERWLIGAPDMILSGANKHVRRGGLGD